MGKKVMPPQKKKTMFIDIQVDNYDSLGTGAAITLAMSAMSNALAYYRGEITGKQAARCIGETIFRSAGGVVHQLCPVFCPSYE